jgi:GR25 family glycosyltransferase involved in LPS biosynthesis
MTQGSYRGIYINLDRSTGRRAEMEAEFARHGLAGRYTRFAALEGEAVAGSALTPGEVGCFRSHAAALARAGADGGYVHVVEDDILLSSHLARYLDGAIASGQLDGLDVLLTDMYVSCDLRLIRFFKHRFETATSGGTPDFGILNLASFRRFASMTSYLVHPAAVPKLAKLYRDALAAGPRLPVDLFLREQVLAGVLRAGCVFPFLTGLRLEHIAENVIGARHARPRSALVMACIRYSFFIDRDLPGYAGPILDGAIGPDARRIGAGPDPHRDFLLRALDHILTRDFELF